MTIASPPHAVCVAPSLFFRVACACTCLPACLPACLLPPFNSRRLLLSLVASVPPQVAMLQTHTTRNSWEDAIRLCRFIKVGFEVEGYRQTHTQIHTGTHRHTRTHTDTYRHTQTHTHLPTHAFAQEESLWACLAIMATKAKELNAAEIAYAAVNAIDKVEFLQRVKAIPTPEGRNAELALFSGQAEEAAAILLQAGLIYRLIDLHTRLFDWDKCVCVCVCLCVLAAGCLWCWW